MNELLKDFGEPRIKLVALPKDTNDAGNIFGGWILSQIDLAGAMCAKEIGLERVVTISLQEVIFKQPVLVGDVISCYAKVIHIGNTSIKTQIEVTALRLGEYGISKKFHVTSAIATYINVTRNGEKRPISKEIKKIYGF